MSISPELAQEWFNIRWDTFESPASIAQRYGVAQSTVSKRTNELLPVNYKSFRERRVDVIRELNSQGLEPSSIALRTNSSLAIVQSVLREQTPAPPQPEFPRRTAADVQRRREAGESVKNIADYYGVSRSTIYRDLNKVVRPSPIIIIPEDFGEDESEDEDDPEEYLNRILSLPTVIDDEELIEQLRTDRPRDVLASSFIKDDTLFDVNKALLKTTLGYNLTRRQLEPVFTKMINTIGSNLIFKSVTREKGEINYFTLTDDNLQQVLDFFDESEYVDAFSFNYEVGSGNVENALNVNESYLFFGLEEYDGRQQNHEGGLYRGFNDSCFDLDRYQIFRSPCDVPKDYLQCGLHTLVLHGYSLNDLRPTFDMNLKKMRRTQFKRIAEYLKCKITILYYDESGKQQEINYGEGTPVNIAEYKNHFFPYEKTGITSYSLKNYEKVKDLDDPGSIIRVGKKKITRAKRPGVTSLRLVKTLDDMGLLPYISLFAAMPEQYVPTPSLEDLYDDVAEFERKKTLDLSPYLAFADIESFVDKNPHRPMMIGCEVLGEYEKFLAVKNPQAAVNTWLKWVRQTALKQAKKDKIKKPYVNVYIHNLKYDYTVLKKYLPISSPLESGGQVYQVKLWEKDGVTIVLKDSFKFLNYSLAKFSSKLGLENKKLEAVNYEWYTEENVFNNKTPVKPYIKKFSLEMLKTFYENAKLNSDGNTFNALEYYKMYLKQDVFTLKEGLLKFFEQATLVAESVNGNQYPIENCITSSSYADGLMQGAGVYDGVYVNKGSFRDWVQEGIYGGRVHVNTKYVDVEEEIEDFDAVSLYPSAMVSLETKYGGLPTGAPLIMKDLKNWRIHDYAMVTIRITKVNKKQQIPFIPERGDGIINYVNHPPARTIRVTTMELKSWIEHHQIEFEILDGVYWGKGRNPKIGEVIRTMFNKRKEEKKKPGGGLQETYKLAMNSSYGKCGEKLHTEERAIYEITARLKDPEYVRHPTKMKDVHYSELTGLDTLEKRILHNENIALKDFLVKNKHSVSQVVKLRTANKYRNKSTFLITRCCEDTSYSRNHIAAFILSESKVIMNQVMGLLNDLDIKVFYTDTDSIHMSASGVEIIKNEFKNKYGRDLVGTELGQFHTDFPNNAMSTRGIFLGKKAYCHQLSDGTYHMSLKGIPRVGIDHAVKDFNSYMELFEYLKSNPYRFCLNPPGKVRFDIGVTKVMTYERPTYRVVDFTK